MSRILLVDDDQSARVTLSIALKGEGFAVDMVDQGEAVLRRLTEDAYDWVISDIQMPELNGIELVHRIKAKHPRVRIALISAYRCEEDLQGLAVEGFLEKPIDIEKLCHLLHHGKLPQGSDFASRVQRWGGALGTEAPAPREVIRFRNASDKEAFERRTFDFYELLEKKVQERTQELLEKQRNLEAAYGALRETKGFLEHLINATPDCVVATDAHGTVLSFNRTAERAYGYGAQEMIGRNIAHLRAPAAQASLPAMYETTLQVGRWRGESEGVRKDGSTFPLSVMTSRVLDESGQVIAILEMSRDMTEAKRMEQQLLYAEKLSVLGQLAPKIAHEINNPLHVVSANAQLGLLMLGDKEKVQACLEKVLSETTRIEHLTRQLMDVARPTELHMRPLSGQELLENAITFLSDVGEIKRLEVCRHYADGLPPLHGDQAQLEQALRNLILNASQAMEGEKKKRLSVGTGLTTDGAFVEIRIADTGCGIAGKSIERIYEPFFTTKDKGKGNGLGMPIVKGIVERHGGYMEVESTLGVGTVFHIYLPAHGAEGEMAAGAPVQDEQCRPH